MSQQHGAKPGKKKKKNKTLLLSKGDAANVREAAKLRLEVISLDTALALSTEVGLGSPALYRG